ncbi:UPF0175 family protein [Pricia sp.]|uniref:UPF0175 family protein n=1 Tax=Pricia sp. TaxID=2268138 RepID=UPI003593E408
MKILKINIPDNLDLKDYELSMILASKLYEERILSLGQAAKVAGLTKPTFMELLGKYGVSIFSDSVSELLADITNA